MPEFQLVSATVEGCESLYLVSQNYGGRELAGFRCEFLINSPKMDGFYYTVCRSGKLGFAPPHRHNPSRRGTERSVNFEEN